MIARVLKYSYSQAKVRAMKGKLLNAEDWSFLLKRDNPGDFLQYLGGAAYSEALSQIPRGKPEPEVVALALYDDLFRDYAKLFRAVPANSVSILKALLARYEAENIKTIFRSIWGGRTPSEARSFLFHLGSISRLPVTEMLQAQTLPDALELLKSTIFHRPLMHALPQWKAQGKLFPLEVAVDMTAFEHLVETLHSLGGRDRKGAERLIGELIDFENLRWLARFRHYYGLTPEETINYILPGGRLLGTRDLGGLARTPDLASFLAALPPLYREALKTARDWPGIQVLFEKWLLGQLYRVFHKDPFQIRLHVSYLLLKEIEVKTLISLVSALSLGESTERFLELMSLPLPEDIRV